MEEELEERFCAEKMEPKLSKKLKTKGKKGARSSRRKGMFLGVRKTDNSQLRIYEMFGRARESGAKLGGMKTGIPMGILDSS